MRRTALIASLACLTAPLAARAQEAAHTPTHADTLRGSITPERAWWDVSYYDLHVTPNLADSTIRGHVGISYRVTAPARALQLDLQAPLVLDSVVQDGRSLGTRHDGNAWFVTLVAPQPAGATKSLTAWYHGRPRVAKHAPWDGGIVWTQDSLGHPWVATAVQGLGASAWWPTKDTQADEPDSQRVSITVPDSLVDVSNGRLRAITKLGDGTTTYEWFVANPINNYDVAMNVGKYAHFARTFAGEKGPLSEDFWPLAYHVDAAQRQFVQADSMLGCFEHWFGPYPWYADGYKLVEAPHLGMEHQSAVAYGNHYANGYLGRDLSHTGLGLKWDFIIVHESGHEWFGNNITSKDIADMWVHEGFTSYSEALYTECQQGKAAGARYVLGNRPNIQNDRPVVARFGINEEGSGDMYYKGANMLHTMRQIVGDDEKWRTILRGLNSTFYHQTVTGQQVRDYMSRAAGIDFSTLFDQYLTTTKVPTLEYDARGTTLRYRWTNVVPGFAMPIRVRTSPTADYTLLHPTERWQTAPLALAPGTRLLLDENFYALARPTDGSAPTTPHTAAGTVRDPGQ